MAQSLEQACPIARDRRQVGRHLDLRSPIGDRIGEVFQGLAHELAEGHPFDRVGLDPHLRQLEQLVEQQPQLVPLDAAVTS